MKNLIRAEIVAHSKRLNTNEELITFKLIYPRIIHSELMTYHMISVNSASSRAIPVDKLIKVIEDTPFYPISYQRKHSGMQGTDYFTSEEDIRTCDSLWKESMQESIRVAKKMLEFGMSKQIINRSIECYQYHCCLMTGSRESFEHLFEQRCPIYEVPYYINDPVEEGEKLKRTLGGCSKKEILKSVRENRLDSEVFSWSDLDWLQHNKGQAEIHFMNLAEKMYDALNESTPDILKEGEWHIPFQEEIWKGKRAEKLEDFIKMSVCLTAKISYTKIGDENTITIEKAREMYERLKNSGHWSCFGHIAKCMTDEERNTWIKGELKQVAFSEFDSETFLEAPEEAKGFSKNLRGFIPLRQYVEDGFELSKFK